MLNTNFELFLYENKINAHFILLFLFLTEKEGILDVFPLLSINTETIRYVLT